jgi:hypothetical protein
MNEIIETENRGGGFFGERLFSGSQVKYFAVALMFIDHLHQFFFNDAVWMNLLGRPVMPIFLFMVGEGFYYSKNRARYMTRLLIGACAMGLLNIVISRAFPMENVVLINNAFGTMFATAFYLMCAEIIKSGAEEKKLGKSASGIALILLSLLISAALLWVMFSFKNLPQWILSAIVIIPNAFIVEGGVLMIALGVAFYVLRRRRLAQAIALIIFSAFTYIFGSLSGQDNFIEWAVVFAVIPILMYNGKRGKGGAFDKWFFYIFYPAHIYIMYFISWFLQR